MNDTKTTEQATPLSTGLRLAALDSVRRYVVGDLELAVLKQDLSRVFSEVSTMETALSESQTSEAELAKALKDMTNYFGCYAHTPEELCIQRNALAALQSREANPASQNNPKETKA